MTAARPGRKRAENGKGRHHHQFKRRAETYRVRLAVINHYRDSRNMDDTLTKFFPGVEGTHRDTKRKSVYLWEKKRAKIVEICSTSKGGQMKFVRDLGTATMLSRDGERNIVQWISELRGEGAPVSAFMLKTKALEVAADEGLSSDDFKASWTFRRGFLHRHLLSLRRHTRQGQKPPEDSNAARHEFREKVLHLMKVHNVDRVYNADQTAVFFEYLPKQTISGRGAKTVWVRCAGKEKERVTVMLLGDSCGTRYTPFVIAKSKPSQKENVAAENKAIRNGFGVGVWREASELQRRLDVVMYGNSKGWWSGELSLAFLRRNFASRANREQPVLLLWDDLSAHWTEEVKACAEELNIVLVPVPPGCTSVCQPADISWNMPLKSRLRAVWLENLQSQLKRPRIPGVKFKLVPPKRKDVTEWVVAAWESLPKSVIKSGSSFIFKPPTPIVSPVPTQTPVGDLETSTAVANELLELGQLDRCLGEVQEDSDVVENAVAGIFEVLSNDVSE